MVCALDTQECPPVRWKDRLLVAHTEANQCLTKPTKALRETLIQFLSSRLGTKFLPNLRQSTIVINSSGRAIFYIQEGDLHVSRFLFSLK